MYYIGSNSVGNRYTRVQDIGGDLKMWNNFSSFEIITKISNNIQNNVQRKKREKIS